MGTVSITQLTNGTTADATAVDNNFNAIADQLNGNIDSTNLAANAVGDAQLATNVSMQTFRKEATANFVQSGLTIATSGSLTSTITSGVAYVNGKRIAFSSTGITVTASKDTYVDLKDDGTIVQVAVSNGAAAGALTLNSDSSNALRIAKLVSSGSAITTSTQTGQDSLGNNIYWRSSAIIAANSATVATSQTTTATSAADLATVGPVVTVTVGNSGMALVTFGCAAGHSSSDLPTNMSFAVSGATTIAAGTNGNTLTQRLTTATAQAQSSWSVIVTGLTPGLNTFTAKYWVTTGTGTFLNRWISVMAI